MGADTMSAGRLIITFALMFSCGIFHYVICRTVADKPFDRRVMLAHGLLLAVEQFISRLLWMYNLSALFALASVMLSAFFLFRVRGIRWLTLSVGCIAATMLLELLCAAVLYLVAGLGVPEADLFVVSLESSTHMTAVVVNVTLTNVMSLVVSLIITLLRRAGRAVKRFVRDADSRVAWMIVRMSLLVLVDVWMITLMQHMIADATVRGMYVEMGRTYVAMLSAACLFVIVCISYLVQDVRYLRQRARNETLEQQQVINDRLLTSLRSFRHNTINMLYGFEGAILNGDSDNLRSYYREMTEKCALVNNENIVALERVGNASVSALLLHTVERAREASLPINLYIQKGLRFGHALSDSDLCAVLGVLLDNAVEAALQAHVRYVSVEMRNVNDACEVIIKNTYAGEITEARLMSGGGSTKPGHSGHGLQSVREILARSRRAYLNMQVTGQYVLAQLVM